MSSNSWPTNDVEEASAGTQKLAESFMAVPDAGNTHLPTDTASWLSSVSLDLERATTLIDQHQGSPCAKAAENALTSIRPAYQSFEAHFRSRLGTVLLGTASEQIDRFMRRVSLPLAELNLTLLVQRILQIRVISTKLEKLTGHTDASLVLREMSIQNAYVADVLAKIQDIRRSVLVEVDAVKAWIQNMRISIAKADEQFSKISRRFAVAFTDEVEISHFAEAALRLKTQVDEQVRDMVQVLQTWRDGMRLIEKATSSELQSLLTAISTVSKHLRSLNGSEMNMPEPQRQSQLDAAELLQVLESNGEDINQLIESLSRKVGSIMAEVTPQAGESRQPSSNAAAGISGLLKQASETTSSAGLAGSRSSTSPSSALASKHAPVEQSSAPNIDSSDPLNAQSSFHVGDDFTDAEQPADTDNARHSRTESEPYKHAKGRTCQQTKKLVESILQANTGEKQKLKTDERFALFDWMYHCEVALKHDGSFRPVLHKLLDLKMFPQYQEPPGNVRKSWNDFGKG